MSGDIPERATCEVCGTSFDPTESRGWCPNTACGQWQHPSFPLTDGSSGTQTGAADGGVDTPMKSCPSCGKDVRADANFCKFCSHEFEDDGEEESAETNMETAGLDECPDCAADLSSIPPERLADCPICGTDLDAVLTDRSEPEATPAELSHCPACSADLTDIPDDMRMVCPDCRIDLREAIEIHGVGGDGEAEAGRSEQASHGDQAGTQTGAQGGTVAETESADDEQTESSGETAVDTIKGIGTSYAERLADAGIETAADLVVADPAQLSATTDISEKRIGEWVERAPIDPADIDQSTADRDDTTQSAVDEQDTDGTGQTTATSEQGAGSSAQGSQGDQQRGTAGQTRGDQQTGHGGQQSGTGARGDQPGPNDDIQVETQIQPNYDTVVLDVMGQDIRASPGDTLGREIRTAMVEGGAPNDDAVYIHREHVRVDREGDTFYLTRLGQNSLKINDEPIPKNERGEISTGDVVSFSEVVTADIRLE